MIIFIIPVTALAVFHYNSIALTHAVMVLFKDEHDDTTTINFISLNITASVIIL